MNMKRVVAAAAVAVGVIAMDVAAFAAVATAQEHHRGRPEGQRRNAAPAARPAQPAPRMAPRIAPQVARPQPRVFAPVPRHFTPPPVRHAAPVHRPSHHAPSRRSFRPWGYGAAAAGVIILGTRLVRQRRSDAEACAADFQSFDWETGTILNADGYEVLCPYLE